MPGRQPLAALGDVIGRISSTGIDVVDGQLLSGPARADALRARPGRLGTEMRPRCRKKLRRGLLFVDQFEELYTLCDVPAERKAFAACLDGIADDPTSPLRVVLSVRSDFLYRVADDRSILPSVNRSLS